MVLATGNRFLTDAFSNGISLNPYLICEIPDEPQDLFEGRVVFSMSDFQDLPISVAFENLSSNVMDRISSGKGIHGVAWFLPFHMFGPDNWGIYIDRYATTRLAIEIATLAREIDESISNFEAQRFVYATVMRHQIEHATQEILIARAVAAGKFEVVQLLDAPFNGAENYREVLATHFQYYEGRRAQPNIDTVKNEIIRQVFQEIPLPDFHEDWRHKSIQQMDAIFERDLGFASNLGSRSASVRDLVDGMHKSKYLQIPAYWWHGNGMRLKLTNLDFAANGIVFTQQTSDDVQALTRRPSADLSEGDIDAIESLMGANNQDLRLTEWESRRESIKWQAIAWYDLSDFS